MGGGASSPPPQPPKKSPHDYEVELTNDASQFTDNFCNQLKHLADDLNPSIRTQLFLAGETEAMSWLEQQDLSRSTSSIIVNFGVSTWSTTRDGVASYLLRQPSVQNFNIFSDRFDKDYSDKTRDGMKVVVGQLSNALSVQDYTHYVSALFLHHGVYLGGAFRISSGTYDTSEGSQFISVASVTLIAATSNLLLDTLAKQELKKEKIELLISELYNLTTIGSKLIVTLENKLNWLTEDCMKVVLVLQVDKYKQKYETFGGDSQALVKGVEVSGDQLPVILANLRTSSTRGICTGYQIIYKLCSSLSIVWGTDRFSPMRARYLEAYSTSTEHNRDLVLDMLTEMVDQIWAENPLVKMSVDDFLQILRDLKN